MYFLQLIFLKLYTCFPVEMHFNYTQIDIQQQYDIRAIFGICSWMHIAFDMSVAYSGISLPFDF